MPSPALTTLGDTPAQIVAGARRLFENRDGPIKLLAVAERPRIR